MGRNLERILRFNNQLHKQGWVYLGFCESSANSQLFKIASTRAKYTPENDLNIEKESTISELKLII